MQGEIHVGDYGNSLRITIKDQSSNVVDLTNALSTQIQFIRPDDTNFAVAASGYGSAVNGVIQYQFVSGDLQSQYTGTWRYRSIITFSNQVLNSDVGSFKLFSNL